MRWFRFYTEALHDPKILRLSDKEFRAWVLMLCIAADSGGRFDTEDLALQMRMSEQKTTALFESLIGRGLIEQVEPGCAEPHNWRNRQYDPAERSESGARGNHLRWHVRLAKPDSDCRYCVAERVANRRDTEADTEAEQNRAETEAEQKQTRVARGQRLLLPFEQCFGRLLSPMEVELGRALMDEHPPERVEYAIREAAASNARSMRFIQRVCERLANDGNTDGANSGKPAVPAGPGGLEAGVSDLERRRAYVASRGQQG